MLEKIDGEEEETDFTAQDERVRQARAYIARKEKELRQRREREASEQKRR